MFAILFKICNDFLSVMDQSYPQYVEEVRGLAEGAEIPFHHVRTCWNITVTTHEHASVSNHPQCDCLLNSLFKITTKKAKHQRSELLAFCEGYPPANGGFHHKGLVMRKAFPYFDVFMKILIQLINYHTKVAVKKHETILIISQQAHDTIIKLSLRQNDVAKSFWRNNNVVIASCARCFYGSNPWLPRNVVLDTPCSKPVWI